MQVDLESNLDGVSSNLRGQFKNRAISGGGLELGFYNYISLFQWVYIYVYISLFLLDSVSMRLDYVI